MLLLSNSHLFCPLALVCNPGPSLRRQSVFPEWPCWRQAICSAQRLRVQRSMAYCAVAPLVHLSSPGWFFFFSPSPVAPQPCALLRPCPFVCSRTSPSGCICKERRWTIVRPKRTLSLTDSFLNGEPPYPCLTQRANELSMRPADARPPFSIWWWFGRDPHSHRAPFQLALRRRGSALVRAKPVWSKICVMFMLSIRSNPQFRSAFRYLC